MSRPGLGKLWFRIGLAAALLTLLRLPALGVGFFQDDLVILTESTGGLRGVLDKYRFLDPARAQSWLSDGSRPWWLDQGVQVAHFRPLSSALMALDVSAWGANRPAWFHLHSLVWLWLFLSAAGALYAMTLPGRTWAPAMLALALACPVTMPAAWWCARHMLVSLCFGMAGAVCYLRYRRRANRSYYGAFIALTALSLLAGESGVVFISYLLALEITSSPRDRARALRAWAGPALIVVLWFLARKIFHGEVKGNFYFYRDPVNSPGRFLAEVRDGFYRPVMILFGSLGLQEMASGPRWAWWSAATACAAVFVSTGVRAARDLPGEARQSLRWLSLGSALSVWLFFVANFEDWTLLVATIGTSGVFGLLIAHAWGLLRGRVAARPRYRWLAILGIGVLLALRLYKFGADAMLVQRFGEVTAGHPGQVAGLELPGNVRRVFKISAMEELPFPQGDLDPCIWDLRLYRPDSKIEGVWPLAGTAKVREITRPAANTLVLDGVLAETDFFRYLEMAPIPAGTEIRAGPVTVRVLESNSSAVTRAEFNFEFPLDDPSVEFIVPRLSQSGRLEAQRIALPPVGGGLRLSAR